MSDRSILYSRSAKLYKRSLISTVHVTRVIHLTEDPDEMLSHVFLHDEVATDDSEMHPLLKGVPNDLWAKNSHDVGLIKGCTPIKITPKSSFRPVQRQYPLKPEAVREIKPVFDSLLKAGIIVECTDSPVRSPIFPLKEISEKGEEWSFVQDLKRVNAAVMPRASGFPNPCTVLAQVPPSATYFSVVDLSNAFFSVPVDPDSQFWFAFEFEGKMFTFTRLPQSYVEAPTIFNTALKESLEGLELSLGSALIQFVDGLMISSPSKEQCERDTVKLLKHLHACGHKAAV